ncbi:MAG: putative signal transducing protein [Desulfomonilaceae bacterium]
MDFDEAVVIRTYASEALASIADSRLRFEGIEAHIQKDDCGGAYPSLQMCGGVRLLIKAEDLEYAERILNEMETEESEKVDLQVEHEDNKPVKSTPYEVPVMDDPPSEQLDQLKTVIFTYIVIAPLLSALFADKIDSIFLACLLFVGLVGTVFVHLRNRMGKLEQSLKEQERRLMELERVIDKESE